MTRYTLAALALTALSNEAPVALVRASHDPSVLYFPAWGTGSNTCTHDDSPTIMFQNNPSWGEETLEDCCLRHYLSDYNDCVTGSGGTLTPTNKWWVDFTNHKCSKDCVVDAATPECGGILGPGTGRTHYDTVELCCGAHYSYYVDEYCTAMSSGTAYAGSDKFYLDSTENVCVKDCDGALPCGGVVTDAWVTMYDTIELCCSNALPSYDPTFCAAQSDPSTTGTNQWFKSGSICKKDCTGTGDECAEAGPYDDLHADADACCQTQWSDIDYCKTRSDPASYGVGGGAYTNKWLVNYSDSICQKDCDATSTDPTCAAASLVTASTDLYADAATCCDTKLKWVDGTTCTTTSESGATSTTTATATNEWYADYSTVMRCVMDCAVDPAGNPLCGGIAPKKNGISFYANAELCCEKKFQWYQQDLCASLSNNAGASNTELWYADFREEACWQDCPVDAAHPSCKGTPTDKSQPLYASAATCCSTKLGWVDSDKCESKSAAGANVPAAAPAATNEWFALNEALPAMCGQDCAVDPASPGCVGVQDSFEGVVTYASVELCCSSKFGWVDSALCAARSNGGAYTDMYWADKGDNVCRKDCATGGAGCEPPTDYSVDLYADAATCCSTEVGWANQASCQGLPESSQATEEWYSKDQTCKKNCPTSSGGDCGGIAESWNTMYASQELCCRTPEFNWKYEACMGTAAATQGTTEWYSKDGKCVKNCVAGTAPECGGLAESWDTMYATSALCCATPEFAWKAVSDCVQS